MKNIAHAGLVLGLALGGCAVMHGDGHPGPKPMAGTPCNTNPNAVCIVRVIVKGCSAAQIVVDPEEAQVAAGARGDVLWLVGGGWKFATDGIAFKHPHADFSNPRGNNTPEFRWHNAHTVAGKYHPYTVTVVKDGQTCVKDPTIMN
jgi:hypothetical protein